MTRAEGGGRRILVIKLGAFGDFIMALGAFAALRRHHRDDHVTLLTIPGLEPLARASGYFDEIRIDPRARTIAHYLDIRRRLRAGRFDRVYDLQCQARTERYFWLLAPGPWPEWSGTARGASHPFRDPDRKRIHAVDRYARQLHTMGIGDVPPPDAGWIDADINRFALPRPFVLLAAGSAPHRHDKRWPPALYGELARRLAARGLTPVLLGTESERAITAEIRALCGQAVDLTGRTGLFDIGGLARNAAGAVGNDTGPMHLIAAAGCPSLALFSHASDPARSGQRGPCVAFLRRPNLADLPVEEVEAALLLRDDGRPPCAAALPRSAPAADPGGS